MLQTPLKITGIYAHTNHTIKHHITGYLCEHDTCIYAIIYASKTKMQKNNSHNLYIHVLMSLSMVKPTLYFTV